MVTLTSIVIIIDSMTPGIDCRDGEIRLSEYIDDYVNFTRRGRVETCLNNAWGTVCNTSFDEFALNITCSKLIGFSTEGYCSINNIFFLHH